MNEDGTYSWPGNQPKKPRKSFDFGEKMKKTGRKIVLAAAALVVLALAGTCFYTVNDKEQAVVTTFGQVTNVVDAGVHFKLPPRKLSWAMSRTAPALTSTRMKAP